jgi:hypothetical protein
MIGSQFPSAPDQPAGYINPADGEWCLVFDEPKKSGAHETESMNLRENKRNSLPGLIGQPLISVGTKFVAAGF